MASRMIHLAITTRLLKEFSVKDENRLKLGVILPDAYSKPAINENSHFKIVVCDGTRKTYNLTKYRELFKERMMTDELYLGYYLHLIQDIVYRQFVYKEHHWDSAIPGNVERLHNDYSLINTYVVHQYDLVDDIFIPKNFEEEIINQMFQFDLCKFLSHLKTDYEPYEKGEIFFFTPQMADEYIAKATDVCISEIKALQNNGLLLDEMEYAWRR